MALRVDPLLAERMQVAVDWEYYGSPLCVPVGNPGENDRLANIGSTNIILRPEQDGIKSLWT